MAEDRIAKIESQLKALQHALAALEAASGLYASDEELRGQYGDPQVKFSPRSWRGPDYRGRHYSECPPDFLDALAEALTYSANNPKPDSDPKWANWNRKDAAKARSYARRARRGGAPPKPAAQQEPSSSFGQSEAFATDEDIPF